MSRDVDHLYLNRDGILLIDEESNSGFIDDYEIDEDYIDEESNDNMGSEGVKRGKDL